ncbi:MAG: hypothetical protein WBI55_04510 [Eubacteriales bacterium]|jgi:hypothetical protein|nr:ABC transporter substrate-binding protein [Clostridiales bacterium]
MIERALDNLIWELEWEKQNLHMLKASEQIIKTIISDGNYLVYHDTLMFNYICQAKCLTRENRFDEAIEALKKSYAHAVAWEEVRARAREKNEPLYYTSPILQGHPFYINALHVTGTSTATEDFQEYLTQPEFDPLREREDFIELTKL